MTSLGGHYDFTYSHRVSLSRRGKRPRLIVVYSRRDWDRSQLEFSKFRNAEESGMLGRSVYLLSQIKNVRGAVQSGVSASESLSLVCECGPVGRLITPDNECAALSTRTAVAQNSLVGPDWPLLTPYYHSRSGAFY